MYKKGDRVRVWSLQSFQNGGFLEGADAVVRQDQRHSSVILAVVQNIGGEYQLNKSYEVYAKQCEPFEECKQGDQSFEIASKELQEYRKELLQSKTL